MVIDVFLVINDKIITVSPLIINKNIDIISGIKSCSKVIHKIINKHMNVMAGKVISKSKRISNNVL